MCMYERYLNKDVEGYVLNSNSSYLKAQGRRPGLQMVAKGDFSFIHNVLFKKNVSVYFSIIKINLI